MEALAKNLSVVVVYEKGKSRRCPIVTHATIFLGPLVVGKAVLGGRFSQPQVLKEFKANRQRFALEEQGYSAAKTLGLAA